MTVTIQVLKDETAGDSAESWDGYVASAKKLNEAIRLGNTHYKNQQRSDYVKFIKPSRNFETLVHAQIFS